MTLLLTAQKYVHKYIFDTIIAQKFTNQTQSWSWVIMSFNLGHTKVEYHVTNWRLLDLIFYRSSIMITIDNFYRWFLKATTQITSRFLNCAELGHTITADFDFNTGNIFLTDTDITLANRKP